MINYDRHSAVAYAKRWALDRNNQYMNFDGIGGDCTNFASQCIFAGAKVMNYTKDIGWYYNSPTDRAAPWSDAEYLEKFLLSNNGIGPFAKKADKKDLQFGDLICLSNGKTIYHSLIVTDIIGDNVYICAHTYDAYMVPLRNYNPHNFEYLHILGVNA